MDSLIPYTAISSQNYEKFQDCLISVGISPYKKAVSQRSTLDSKAGKAKSEAGASGEQDSSVTHQGWEKTEQKIMKIN